MFGFNVNKLKPNLTMAVHRIGIVKNKKANAALVQRREVARLLREGKEEKARIRVEGIIRDDLMIEGYEILELLCDLLAERANLIKTEFDCPHDMREAVCTLMWAANRTDVPELAEVKRQLTRKYGQDFEAAASRNVDGCVNGRVMQKLSVHPPSAFLVVNYMKEIAREFHVDWAPKEAQVIAADPLAPIPVPAGAFDTNGTRVSGSDFSALHASVRSVARRRSSCQGVGAPSSCMGGGVGGKYTNYQVAILQGSSVSGASASHGPRAPSGPSDTGATDDTAASLLSSRRTVQSYTNQPTHYFSTRSSQPVSIDQLDDDEDESIDPMQPAPVRSIEELPLPPSYPVPTATTTATASLAAVPMPPPSSGGIPDFDELTARFERLRKRQDRHDQGNMSFTF
ncbi:unnamed protein product [Hyaloperonospora brassicae]|uniref:IST1 homolog n=1 Tax=Hyaloperonospora brassicae TaxID=162125 RepID=A0AAV0V0W0_HYABA|nr:unnamed protein product [Hyaloperonospora brassicae]